jgi:hypothetical protein
MADSRNDKRRPRRTRYALLFIAVLMPIVLYLGSYYAMAKREWRVKDPNDGIVWPHLVYRGESSTIDRLQGIGDASSDVIDAFFGPAHDLDRLLRPGYWGPQKRADEFDDVL